MGLTIKNLFGLQICISFPFQNPKKKVYLNTKNENNFWAFTKMNSGIFVINQNMWPSHLAVFHSTNVSFSLSLSTYTDYQISLSLSLSLSSLHALRLFLLFGLKIKILENDFSLYWTRMFSLSLSSTRSFVFSLSLFG